MSHPRVCLEIRVSVRSGVLLGAGAIAVAVCVLVLGMASVALAADPPEAPITSEPAEVKAATAVLQDVVDPLKSAEVSWFFEYKAGTACTGGSTTPMEGPAEVEAQPVAVGIEHLVAHTEYTACLVAEDASGRTAGNAIHFTTATPPQTPKTEAATGPTATTVTLHGEVNPTGEAETGYHFLYSTEATCAANGSETEGVAPARLAAESKVHLEATGLQPHRSYVFCLVATNSAGEAVQSANELKFETLTAPPEVEGESAPEVTSGSAKLEASINPNNEKTSYRFEYATKASGEPLVLEAPITTVAGASELEGYPGQPTGPVATGALLPDTTYYYRAVAENAQSKTEPKPAAGKVEHFQTFPEAPEKLGAQDVTGTTAKLRGVLNPNNTGDALTYEFVYSKSESECTGAEQKSTVVNTATSPVYKAEVSANVTGLGPGTKYTYCLRAHNGAGEATGSPDTLETNVMGEESALRVEASEAVISAELGTAGAETSYHAEYGIASVEEHSTPEARVPASSTIVTAEQTLKSLQPATTYHFRFIANNGHGPITGGETVFTTPATPGSEPPQTCSNEQLRSEQPFAGRLPECRAYELVSPANTGGQDATEPYISGVATSRAALSGEGITYGSRGGFAESAGVPFTAQYLSRRGAGGWSTQSITAPDEAYAGLDNEYAGYRGLFFTPELSEGVTGTFAAVSPEAPKGLMELYRADFADGAYQLVSHLPPAEEFYGELYAAGGTPLTIVVGASTDLSHVVFELKGPLREWAGGQAFPVSVSNSGEAWEGTRSDVWHAVSADGSRIVFEHSGEQYARVNTEQPQGGEACEDAAGACTIKLSNGSAQYQGANSEDTEIFYTENEDLYEYSLPAGQVAGHATALTHGGGVQGVVQISENGSYVYFAATGALRGSHGEALRNGEGQEPEAGEPNLYLSREGHLAFVVTLSSGDAADWRNGPDADTTALAAGPGGGARLAFVSEDSLTGYDNQQAQPGECEANPLRNGEYENGKCREVYLFDAETGTLACASCDPTGARPVGGAELGAARESLGDYRPHELLEDGAVFFDSDDALVPHASDDLENVYEYEDSRVYAISNVAGGHESFFLDASPDGQNVFFATADDLVGQDTSNNIMVYDARVGGGFPAPAPGTQCDNGDSCKPPASAQPGVFAPTGSATFNGPGNPSSASPPPSVVAKPKALTKSEKLAAALKACRRDKKKARRQSCEKQARQRYGAAKRKAKNTNGKGRK